MFSHVLPEIAFYTLQRQMTERLSARKARHIQKSTHGGLLRDHDIQR